jgi:mono/diheme cytochrome c family protein
MSTPDRVVLVTALLLAAMPSLAAESPQLGTPITPAEMAAWDLSIQPDGRGLPAGSGNAVTGKAIFAEKCVVCHNEEGKGQPFDRLVGGQGTLASTTPVKTIGSFWPYASTVFDYIRRAMPLVAPQSLTNDEAYSLTAYLLSLNGIIKERDVMNAKTLAQVKMPNQGGFIVKYPETSR